MGKQIIKLNENVLKNLIKKEIHKIINGSQIELIYESGLERKLVNLIESKGVAVSGNINLIRQLTQILLKAFKTNNKKSISYKSTALKITKEIRFVFRDINQFGMAYQPDESGTMDLNGGTFQYITIAVNFARNSTEQQIESGLVHELNHATEDFYRKLASITDTNNNVDYTKHPYGFADYYDEPQDDRIAPKYYDYASNVKFPSVSNNSAINAAFRNIMYYIYTNTEFNAHVAQIYGELDALKSHRNTFFNDLKKTETFQNYKFIKDKNFPTIKQISDMNIWKNFFQNYFHNIHDNARIEHLKNQFLKDIDEKLDLFYIKMCSCAEQYYIDKEK